MSRRRRSQTRDILPDPKYGKIDVSRFINMIMRAGKKSIAEKIVYGALDLVKERSKADELGVFSTALANVKPTVEVKSRRVGGATYQVPIEVRPSRQQTLAMRWIIEAARNRKKQPMVDKLAAELMDAAEERGAAIKRREDTLKMAKANKAFSHYRW